MGLAIKLAIDIIESPLHPFTFTDFVIMKDLKVVVLLLKLSELFLDFFPCIITLLESALVRETLVFEFISKLDD